MRGTDRRGSVGWRWKQDRWQKYKDQDGKFGFKRTLMVFSEERCDAATGMRKVNLNVEWKGEKSRRKV